MNSEERETYLAHRLSSSRETLVEARILFEAKRLRGAVNRIYYGMFYAVSALALSRDFSTSSHSQLRGYLNREFVKTGALSADLGRAYGTAFDSRTKGDYDDLVEFEAEEVEKLLQEAETFIRTVADLIPPDSCR